MKRTELFSHALFTYWIQWPSPAVQVRRCWISCLIVTAVFMLPRNCCAGQVMAGVAKVDITDPHAKPINDPLYSKALVLKEGSTIVVLITVDAVSIGEIGKIRNDFLGNIRQKIQKELGITPAHVVVNASHCHGVVCDDIEDRTVKAVREAVGALVPVSVGAGAGHEDRIMENRRLKLKNGSEADVRHAYSLPADKEVAAIGPVDPEIGLVRFDRNDGKTLAAIYNFACHPIQGVPSGGNSADIPGFASKAIEENIGEGAMAFFVQGCAGDINPVMYKDVHNPRDAEPLGNRLGLSALRGLRQIKTREQAELRIINEMIALPRGADLQHRMTAIQAEQAELLRSLRGTSLNFKTFLPLYVQHKVNSDFPAYYSHRYLRDQALGRDDLSKLDAENRSNMESYVRNIMIMEQLTRLQTNFDLLKKHLAQNEAAASPTLDVELVGIRIGDFYLVTFPGELTVEIGLQIKQRAPHPLTFVAGYTNGYIYYTPTESQRKNTGYAQEDCDCLVAPEWRQLFDERVDALLKKLDS